MRDYRAYVIGHDGHIQKRFEFHWSASITCRGRHRTTPFSEENYGEQKAAY
jgi:hypothetical protein